jgi:Galactose mutarotase and related enzymes
MRSPTGAQYELTHEGTFGTLRAVVTQVAAGLRAFTLGGADLTEPFGEEAVPPSGDGITLVPWPNRVRDGRWILRSVDGAETAQQLALTEPAKGNAIHGLLRYAPYELVSRDARTVTQRATVYPQPGYPFLLDVTVRHRLTDAGLDVTTTVVNAGGRAAPVAVGAHPYLRVGEVPTETLVLRVVADTHLVSDERGNVIGSHPVDGTEYDLRAGRTVAEVEIDDGWADAQPVDGVVQHSLTAPDGRAVVVWGDADMRYVQAFTHRSFGTLPAGSVAVAIEPMTAPANALNTGDGLRWLAPGEEWSVRWGIQPSGAWSPAPLVE